MRLLVQWTRANPQGWEELEIGPSGQARRAWERTPAKPDPTGTNPPVDDQPGWVHALGCQGITFSADHYAVEPAGDGLRIVTWNDAPTDWPPGTRHAYVWTLASPGENTAQSLEVFAEPGYVSQWIPRGLRTTAGEVPLRPWAEFTPPPNVRHGKGVPDALHAQHDAVRTPHVWRDWVG